MNLASLENQIFAVNKPVGPTSNDVLNALRKKLNTRKMGHAGTLDPLAQGVLVVAVGAATRKLSEVVGQEKEYLAQIHFGSTSATDDAEGPLSPHPVSEPPTIKKIQTVLSKFEGRIQQTPPVFSAIKVRGQEAYKRVRAGEAVQLAPRVVEIKEIEPRSYHWPMLELRVVCGKGVYIRSLARDLGETLGVGAYLAGLTRTRIGAFTLEQALSMGDFGIRFS